jgi:hypothetical protein
MPNLDPAEVRRICVEVVQDHIRGDGEVAQWFDRLQGNIANNGHCNFSANSTT